MANAKGLFEWNQTASLLAMICSIFHDSKKGKPPSPNEFNPYVKKRDVKITAPLSTLKMFVKNADKNKKGK